MSEAFRVRYDRNRYPVQPRRADGTWGCRGCGGAIPAHRESWCSKACYNMWEPKRVIAAVKKRDGGKCQMCGLDCAHELALWRVARNSRRELFRADLANSYHAVEMKIRQWARLNPSPGRAEYDHIIPFSEGGLTVLENMRTLCATCHKFRTQKWRREKALSKP